MSEAQTTIPDQSTALPKLIKPPRVLGENPVVLKELRSRMRGNRTFIIITVYLVLMSCIVGFLYLGFDLSNSTNVGAPTMPQVVGKSVFGMVVGIELMMVCFLAPALTAGSIAAERERQTFDLLRTTLLPARSLVIGKLFSALSFLLLLLFVGFPVQSIAFLLGGVSIEEVFASFVLLLVTALTFSTIGLFISSFMRTTLAATVVSYVAAILVVFGPPTIISMLLGFFGSLTSGFNFNFNSTQQAILEAVLIFFGYILVSLNPIATLIASEIMLLEQQSFLYTTIPLTNGWKFPIVAPWISYFLLYLLFSLVLILLSIRFVRRVEQ